MKYSLFLVAAPAAVYGLGGINLPIPQACEPPSEIIARTNGAVTYPGNVTVTIEVADPKCDAHKTPLTVTYPGALTINNGQNISYTMVACYQKGHVVDFATNSSGWEVTNKTGSFEGKHVASERKKPWYKFDLDFAVNIDIDIRKSSKRALGMFSDMDEAFDVKVPGCKPSSQVDLEFGIGNASTAGKWSGDAAEVSVSGDFGSGRGRDGGKYTAVFKTEKEVSGPSTAAAAAAGAKGSTASGSAAGSPSGTAAAAAGGSGAGRSGIARGTLVVGALALAAAVM